MRYAFATLGLDNPPVKPRGGYRIINAALLAAPWWAYRHKIIRLVDLRVWFATHEMDARRCRVEADFPRRFHLEELRKLTGLSLKRIKDALRRLQNAQLLKWSEAALEFPRTTADLDFHERAGLAEFLDRIPNADRKIPVPRRTLRLLAGGARPALIATLIAHLIRGLYLKSGKCLARGRVKASWIADLFGVALRRVKQARHELIATGWLIPLDADQWALNRWGAHFRINLEWSRLDDIAPVSSPAPNEPATPKLAPPPDPIATQLAPPDSYEKPLNGREKNQKPASGPPGVSCSDSTQTISKAPIPPQTVRESLPPAPTIPNLRDVVVEDLKDTGRLLDLYDQAVGLGYVTTSERDRLRFVGAAEHARVIGTRNPCGLFVRLVRCGLWTFLTQDDEDAANARLKHHLYGVLKAPEATPVIQFSPVLVELSEDARLVREIRAAALRSQYRGDAFPLWKRAHPEWTRERWDVAQAELENAACPGALGGAAGPYADE